MTITWKTIALDPAINPSDSSISIAYGNGVWVIGTFLDYKIWYSNDLLSWTEASAPFEAEFADIEDIYFSNGIFVAVGKYHGLSSSVSTSTDGVTWSAFKTIGSVESFPDPGLRTLGVTSDGAGNWLAWQDGGGCFLYSIDNGSSWYFIEPADGGLGFSGTFGNGVFVVLGAGEGSIGFKDNVVTASPDTLTVYTDSDGADYEFKAVAFGNNIFLKWNNATVWSSTDGISWSSVGSLAGDFLDKNSLSYGNRIRTWVATGSASSLVYESTDDGITWTLSYTGSNIYQGFRYLNGKFIGFDAGTHELVVSSSILFIVGTGVTSSTGADILAYNGVSFTSIGIGILNDSTPKIGWAGAHQGKIWVSESDQDSGNQSTDGVTWTTEASISSSWTTYGTDAANNIWHSTSDLFSGANIIYKNGSAVHTISSGNGKTLMAFHPTDANIIAVIYGVNEFSIPAEVHVDVSTDGGTSWNTSADLINSAIASMYPIVDLGYGIDGGIAINSNGVIVAHFNWTATASYGTYTNSVAYSTDNGASWSRIDFESADSFGLTGFLVASGSRFVVAYGYQEVSGEVVTRVRYSDDGASWTLATSLTDPAGPPYGIFQPGGLWYNSDLDECWVIHSYYGYQITGFLQKGVSGLSSWSDESGQVTGAGAWGFMSISYPGLSGGGGGGGGGPSGPNRYLHIYEEGGQRYIPIYTDGTDKFLRVYGAP